KHLAQRVGIELRIPGTDRLVILAEYPDQRSGKRVRLRYDHVGVGPGSDTCGRDLEREVGRVARPERRLGHVQLELGRIAAQAGVLVAHTSPASRLVPYREGGNRSCQVYFTLTSSRPKS